MKSTENPKEPSTGKSKKTKLVILVARPDGSSSVYAYELAEAPSTEMKINGTAPVSSKMFEKIPKRIRFFIEKAFSKFTAADMDSDDSN